LGTKEGDLNREPTARARTPSTALCPDRLLPVRALCLEVVGYGLVSAVALAIDAAILQTLVTIADWHYLPASTVSFIAGAAVAYTLSVRFVFRSRQLDNRVLEFGYFLGLGLVGLLVNAVALSVVISGVGLGLMTGKLVAAVCTFGTNFVLRRRLLFSPSRTQG
jgi:putative flippase GtrA